MPQLEIQARKIVRTEGVCGGVPILEGTRIRVSDIVIQHEHFKHSPEEITADFPALSIADIYAALTYYYEHPREIRDEIKAREELSAEIKRKQVNGSNSVR